MQRKPVCRISPGILSDSQTDCGCCPQKCFDGPAAEHVCCCGVGTFLSTFSMFSIVNSFLTECDSNLTPKIVHIANNNNFLDMKKKYLKV